MVVFDVSGHSGKVVMDSSSSNKHIGEEGGVFLPKIYSTDAFPEKQQGLIATKLRTTSRSVTGKKICIAHVSSLKRIGEKYILISMIINDNVEQIEEIIAQNRDEIEADKNS